MFKHLYTLIAAGTRIDADSNSVTINDVIEELTFTAELNNDSKKVREDNEPFAVPFRFEVSTATYRDDTSTKKETTLKIKVLDPTKKQLGEFTIPLVFEKGMRRVRGRVKLDQIVLTSSGTYLFETYLVDDKSTERKQCTTPLDVSLILN